MDRSMNRKPEDRNAKTLAKPVRVVSMATQKVVAERTASAGVKRLLRSIDLKRDRAERQIGILLDHQARRRA
jgi:hypothetical protein